MRPPHCRLECYLTLHLPKAQDIAVFSTNERLAPIVLNLAAWSVHANLQVVIEHISGVHNVWADNLSRDSFQDLGFDVSKRLNPEGKQLWDLGESPTLLPQGGFWHPSMVSLREPSP